MSFNHLTSAAKNRHRLKMDARQKRADAQRRCRIGCPKPKAQEWHLLCPDCWGQLPKNLQDDVWREYKAHKGSGEHMLAIRRCYAFFHERDGSKPGFIRTPGEFVQHESPAAQAIHDGIMRGKIVRSKKEDNERD